MCCLHSHSTYFRGFGYYYVVRRYFILFFFFFQAEDGIRDVAVTGVQTCALPISLTAHWNHRESSTGITDVQHPHDSNRTDVPRGGSPEVRMAINDQGFTTLLRSEERRVGKECRSRWSPYH